MPVFLLSDNIAFPPPRLVLYPYELRVSRSLKKIIKKGVFTITADTAFEQVINQCAKVRLRNNEETWIVDDMISAYNRLHESGIAHSVEAWHNSRLVGGLYGVSIGRCFFGESMFTLKSNASKVAFVRLVEYLKQLSFHLIDCQVTTEHLMRFGARMISRELFIKQLQKAVNEPYICNRWVFD